MVMGPWGDTLWAGFGGRGHRSRPDASDEKERETRERGKGNDGTETDRDKRKQETGCLRVTRRKPLTGNDHT